MPRTVSDQIFEDEEVIIDGWRFEGCTFKRCTFIYSGEDAPTFFKCEFDQVAFRFQDMAEPVVTFLRQLYASGLRDLADVIISRPAALSDEG